MRYVIFGAGAVGGTIGGLLYASGQEVVCIARGAHLDALRRSGLRLQLPDQELQLAIPVVASAGELDLTDDDVVILTVKTQDSPAALDALVACASSGTAVVCAQNGVENERLALRWFARVYGMCVMLPANHVEPGVVQANGQPRPGILDIGRYPQGVDALAQRIKRDLQQAGFGATAQPTIMPMKYRKLLRNLANGLEAISGPVGLTSELAHLAWEEGVAALEAAGLAFATADMDKDHSAVHVVHNVGSSVRHGRSSWQSLARGTGSIETGYLNGEIVLLGRQHGVATPVNALIQHETARMAREMVPPGSVSVQALKDRLDSSGPALS